MQTISTLFTAIGDYFLRADWYATVKWPFWILLYTVTIGGIYCARFGKKTLLNQGVSGVLNLVVIYLTAIIGYIYLPPLRSMFSKLPFLSVTQESVTLVDPFSLNPVVLMPVLLRLMILTLLINLMDSYVSGGKTLLTWVFSQLATVGLGLLFHAIVITGLSVILPSVLTRYAIIPVGLVAFIGVSVFCAKIIFTVFISGGNPYFSTVYKFFTVNKAGSLFTTSTLSFLMSMIVLLVLQMTGHTTLEFATANTDGLWIVLLLLLVALYIFGMFYNDRKKT